MFVNLSPTKTTTTTASPDADGRLKHFGPSVPPVLPGSDIETGTQTNVSILNGFGVIVSGAPKVIETLPFPTLTTTIKTSTTSTAKHNHFGHPGGGAHFWMKDRKIFK